MPDDEKKDEKDEKKEEAKEEASSPDMSPEEDRSPEVNERPAKPAAAAVREVEEEEPAPPPVSEPNAGLGRWIPLALAAAVPFLFFFVLPPLTKSGLWDPYELNVADLARRMALKMFGAANLDLAGADSSLPHLNDLGRPQLPFTSIAIGFKLFGLHEWAGRAPLALWGLAGVLATYAWVARLFDRRAGLYSAIALTTMPLFFVQARSMLGEICTMTAISMAFGGLLVAVIDRDEKGPTTPLARLPWLVMGAAGLFVGFESRGALLGVAAPLLAVGASWALGWAAGSRKADLLGDAIGVLGIAAGGFLLWRGLVVLAADPAPKDLSMMVGAMVKPQGKYPTFDFYVASIGHSLAPWSAFLPFAIGRLFLPPVGRSGSIFERESLARMAVVIGGAAIFAAHGLLAAKTDLIAFCGPAIFAAACGVAIRDYERGAKASIGVGLGTLLLCAVFHHDFHELPDKAYQAFAVVGAAFPDSFKEPSLTRWWIVLGGFGAAVFITFIERDAKRRPFDPATYTKVFRALREAWDGILALGFFAVVAGAALGGLVIWIGMRMQANWVRTMSVTVRDGMLNAWWFIAFVPLAVIFAFVFACDVWLWAFNRRSDKLSWGSFLRGFGPFEELFKNRPQGEDVSGWAVVLLFMLLAVPAGVGGIAFMKGAGVVKAIAFAVPSGIGSFLLLGLLGDVVRTRAAGMAFFGAAVGFVLCFSYYPALANQLSPKEIFESYQRVHKGDEPLALLGVGNKTAAYYAGGQPPQFADVGSAYPWLAAPDPAGRRYLAMRADDLPRLNEMFREHSPSPHQNLPVLDARSSQIMLAASALLPGEANDNPLGKMILSAPPHPQRPLDANMEDKLQVLGIDVVDPNGKAVDSIAPGKKYVIRTYYKVLAGDCHADPCHPVTTEWEAFIHIDGGRKRHNGDHKPMNSKYPMSLWLKDDLLVDEYDFTLEPNFTQGVYTIYFGLFVGETRLKVKSGPSDGENRINGGTLRVQ
jgi:hypothetical protein